MRKFFKITISLIISTLLLLTDFFTFQNIAQFIAANIFLTWLIYKIVWIAWEYAREYDRVRNTKHK